MPSFDPTIDAAFRESAELELRCHHLLLDGKEDDPETLAAEDRMTGLWEKLDEVQRRSLNGMGSDLNWVRRKGEPPPKGRKLPTDVTDAEQQELASAIGAKEWHKVLHFLRLCAPRLSSSSLAHWRGIAYDAVGLPAYASVFQDLGWAIGPGKADIGFAALSSTEKTNPVPAEETRYTSRGQD